MSCLLQLHPSLGIYLPSTRMDGPPCTTVHPKSAPHSSNESSAFSFLSKSIPACDIYQAQPHSVLGILASLYDNVLIVSTLPFWHVVCSTVWPRPRSSN